MKLQYFYPLKALWDDQGKVKMYYGTSRVKKQLSGKSLLNEQYDDKNKKILSQWSNRLLLFLYVNFLREQTSETKLMLLNTTIALLQEKSCLD